MLGKSGSVEIQASFEGQLGTAKDLHEDPMTSHTVARLTSGAARFRERAGFLVLHASRMTPLRRPLEGKSVFNCVL
jgi:hypothetical protein